MNNFTYAYTGNQLTKINNGSSYVYDSNGNMTTVPRKNLTFTYNSLNLVQEVKSGSTVKAKYQYAADGTKRQVRDASGANGYDYLGSLTLVKANNVTTPEVAFSEGIIRGSEILFFERDHLGSVRVVLNSSGQVQEKNDYYPFGLRHSNASHPISASNRYKFNGMEEQVTGDLKHLDYGWRMYDPQLGRWFKQDRYAEKYYSQSPYSYVGGNPIKNIDIKGDSINIAWIQQTDKALGTNYTQTFVNDLASQTGLTYSISSGGILTYSMDASGNAVIATDAKGNQLGSAMARNHMMDAIGHADMVTVLGGVSTSAKQGTNLIGFNTTQMDGLVNGAVGVDNRTMGWGLTFMHELYHTQVGGGLSDSPYSPGNPGPVVTNMNTIRAEFSTIMHPMQLKLLFWLLYEDPSSGWIHLFSERGSGLRGRMLWLPK